MPAVSGGRGGGARRGRCRAGFRAVAYDRAAAVAAGVGEVVLADRLVRQGVDLEQRQPATDAAGALGEDADGVVAAAELVLHDRRVDVARVDRGQRPLVYVEADDVHRPELVRLLERGDHRGRRVAEQAN